MLSTTTVSQAKSTAWNWVFDITAFLLVFGVFYFLWAGTYPLFTPDEGRYSEVAREMAASGDYFSLRLNGVAFLDKPMLYYWLQASAIKLFGLSEWALRFWPLMIGLFGGVMTYIAGRFLFNRRTGILSAIVLATTLIYFGGSHYANLDLEVAVFISASLFSFIIAMQANSNEKKFYFYLAGYIFAALAGLTKGLIGLVFPAMIIGTWVLILSRWKILKEMYLLTGSLIFLAITVPCYLLIQKFNPGFFHFFFITQQFSRFLSHGSFNNRIGFWFYVPVIAVCFFPWSVFILQAIGFHLKSIWQNRHAYGDAALFLILWFFLIFVFFSLPLSKTIGYILPIFPALAVLTGSYLDLIWENRTAKGFNAGIFLFIISSLLTAVFCVALPVFQFLEFDHHLVPFFWSIAGIAFVSAVVAIILSWKKNPLACFTVMALTACAYLIALLLSATAMNVKTVKPLALDLRNYLTPQDEVVNYYRYYQDLPVYLQRRITIVADWYAPNIIENDNWLREMWFGMPYQDTRDWLIDEKIFWQRWSSPKRLFVFINTNYFDQFNQQAKNHYHKIAQYNDVILVSNQR